MHVDASTHFLWQDYFQQQSPQLSVFLNSFSSKPDGRIEGNHCVPSDMMLHYISQMLMEDDIDDTLSDHPALLQVQQPFAQILSSCFGSDNGDTGEASKDL